MIAPLLRMWRVNTRDEVCKVFFFGFNLFRGLGGFVSFFLAVAAAVWAFKDARKRGYAEWLWTGIAFSLFPLGFLAYLAYRTFAGVKERT